MLNRIQSISFYVGPTPGTFIGVIMLVKKRVLCVLTCFGILAGLQDFASGYTYVTEFFQVPLDHFSFAVNTTFNIRYLYNDTFWKKNESGPIFFYTGNEGSIESFADNTGFMWDIAGEFGAMVVFAEHRFYGKSFPHNFSYTSGDNSIMGYLTVEQTLADFARLITFLKNSLRIPVISFGGSYGGQLTAYLRMKYPHIVQGGLASSAPFLTSDESLCQLHDKTLTSVFTAISPTCSDSVRKSWRTIDKVANTEKGMEWLTTSWKLCDSIRSEENITTFKSWLNTMYNDLAMVNYPYPTNFLRHLPGNPVKVFCDKLTKSRVPPKGYTNDQILLHRLYKAVNMYFNHTGTLNCLDYGDTADTSSIFSLADSQSFDFQSCTELIDPDCDDGIEDFFEPESWSLKNYTDDCQQEFGLDIVPRIDSLDFFYGGRNILYASNIIFSNGVLDPWFEYGIRKNLSESLTAIIIEDAAHHLDLRGSDPRDPPSVIAARNQERSIIRKWIEEYHSNEERLEDLFG